MVLTQVALAKDSGQFDEGVADLKGSSFTLRSSQDLFVDPVQSSSPRALSHGEP